MKMLEDREQRRKALTDVILSMGLDYFFTALMDVADDSIKTINKKFPDAYYSLAVWHEIREAAEKMSIRVTVKT